MAIDTPQLNVPIYQPKDIAQAPGPTGMPSQVQPVQAGFANHTGDAAFYANNILQGWLKGRQERQQKELAKAQTNIQGADFAYQTMAQNYNDLLRQGKAENDPEVQKAKQGAMSAWQAKLGVMQQYAQPDDQKGKGKAKGVGAGKPKDDKKGVGEELKGWAGSVFGKAGIEPHMIPAASLHVLQNSAPPGLGLTPQDKAAQQQLELGKQQLAEGQIRQQDEQIKLRADQRLEEENAKIDEITRKPMEQRTQADRQWIENYQRSFDYRLRLTDPGKAMLNEALRANETGHATPDQRNMLVAAGVLRGPTTSFVKDGLKNYAVTFDPVTGKEIGQRQYMGRDFHEDQAAIYIRQMQGTRNLKYDEIAQAMGVPPGGHRDSQAVWKEVTLEESRNPLQMASFMGGNPVQREQDELAVDAVLRKMQSIKPQEQDGLTGTQKKQGQLARYANFQTVPNESNGAELYRLRNPQAQPDGTFSGGLDAKQLAQEHALFASAFREAVHKQFPKWTPDMIQAFMDRVTPAQAGQGKPPQGIPSASAGMPPTEGLTNDVGQQQPMQPPPPPSTDGSQSYVYGGGGVLPAMPTSTAMNPPPLGGQPGSSQQVYGNNVPGSTPHWVYTSDQGWKQWYMTDYGKQQAQAAGLTVQ